MDLFIEAFMRFGSYFMITYFAYSIFGRKTKIALIIYAVLFISILSSLLRYVRGGAPSNIIMIVFMVELFPLLVAFFLFTRISGLRINKRIIKTKQKTISSDIQPKYALQMTYIGLTLFALIFGVGSYFLVDNWMKWVIISASFITLIFSIYMLIKLIKISTEYVCLIIGRDQKSFYTYQIQKQIQKVTIKDFFSNENYIVDPIGVIHIKEVNKTENIYYLYWVATNDKIDMSGEKVLTPFKPVFIDYIDQFEKYHYRVMKLSIDDKSRISIDTHKKIK